MNAREWGLEKENGELVRCDRTGDVLTYKSRDDAQQVAEYIYAEFAWKASVIWLPSKTA